MPEIPATTHLMCRVETGTMIGHLVPRVTDGLVGSAPEGVDTDWITEALVGSILNGEHGLWWTALGQPLDPLPYPHTPEWSEAKPI